LSFGEDDETMGGPQPVLIVDDDEPTREALSELLAMEGYEVVSAANGRDALRLLRELQPCVILLDYAMPVMDGRAFREAQKADSRWADIPVILITAHHLTAFAERSIDALGVLQKPINFDALEPLLERACGEEARAARMKRR
jgi:CheY-like chemotaxis protein